MLSQKSLRFRFIVQLASASTMLILIISVLLYQYIKVTIYEGISQSLAYEAKILSTNANLSKIKRPFEYFTLNDSPTRAKLVRGKVGAVMRKSSKTINYLSRQSSA